jgi:Ohr subfamily peroxiredoxin
LPKPSSKLPKVDRWPPRKQKQEEQTGEHHDPTRERAHDAPRRKSSVHAQDPHHRGTRERASRSLGGRLDVKLSLPGSARIGTNPEQLFAAGWSACFESAIGIAAHNRKIILPADVAIEAEVDLHLADSGYFLSTRLNISLRVSSAK